MAKHILIVDDDLYIRELYEEVLQDEGYRVDTAVDGIDGIEKIEKKEYDVVLLDVMMPKLDGLGVLKKISEKKVSHPPRTIILLTNLSHDPIITDALELGATTFLIKADITPDQLVEKIKELSKS